METWFLMSFDAKRRSGKNLLGDNTNIGRVSHCVVFGYVDVGCISYVPSEYIIVVECIDRAVDTGERLRGETEIAKAIRKSRNAAAPFHQRSMGPTSSS